MIGEKAKKHSTPTTQSTKNLANRADSNSLFSIVRQFKSHDVSSKNQQLPRSTKQSPSPTISHSSIKSQKIENASYLSPAKKPMNNRSLFHQITKQRSSQALKKKHQRFNTNCNEKQSNLNKQNVETLDILEIDDSVIYQESEMIIDNEIDERENEEYILNIRKTYQLNRLNIICNEKINNPFNEIEIKNAGKHNHSNGDSISLCNQMIINAKKGDKEAFIELLENCLNINPDNVNFTDDNEWSALHYACNEGNLKIVESLLKAKCNSNILTTLKQTPLHLSAKNGFFDISKLLIDNKALLNPLDNENNTPMHLCASNGHLELVKYILKHSPHLDIKNINGKTPYDVAKSQEIKDIIDFYVKKNEEQSKKIPIEIAKDDSLNLKFKKYNSRQEKKNMSPTKDNTRLKKKTIDPLLNSPNSYGVNVKTEGNIKVNGYMNTNANMISQVQKPSYKDKSNVTESAAYTQSIKKNKTKNVTINLKSQHKTKPFDVTSPFSPYKRKSGIFEQINKSMNIYRNHSVNTSINKVKLRNTEEETKQRYNFEYLSKERKTKSKDKQRVNTINHIDRTLQIENNHLSQLNNLIEEEKINPNSFVCLALLGRGSFGEVFLVRKMNTENLFAMKVITKTRITNHNLFKYAMVERNVLSLTNHPFIVKLSFAFQTTDRLFLILEYCSGGDLTKHLYYEKRFNEEKAKFYLCEIILALEDLHKRDIIFRDLKPDNIVLDKDGHVKVTDFGLSKEGVLDSIGAKSFCGSIAYLAPEMLRRTGHGKAVDWYLLGVLFYEMLVGIPPFFTDQKDEIFRNIEHGELQIPKFISNEAAQLLRELLEKDPEKRLGGGRDDANEIRQHQYFSDVNWDDVYNKKKSPPKQEEIHKHLQYFKNPKMFSNNMDYNEDSIQYFEGWSFIQKNEDLNNQC